MPASLTAIVIGVSPTVQVAMVGATAERSPACDVVE